ncbi:MAG: hypothetical protein KDA86_15250 [Planctomycetaceae bacterium]|nr:hypothetical protein [Planctomycetaceae bacterium]
MRHSKIDLTMNVYTDPKLMDVKGALETHPTLSLDTGQHSQAKATGTDDPRPRPLAPDSDSHRQSVSLRDSFDSKAVGWRKC